MSAISKIDHKKLSECCNSRIERSEQWYSRGGRIMGNFYFNQAAAICMFLSTLPSIGPTYTDPLQELTTLIFGNTDITVELTTVKNTLSELRRKSAELPAPGFPTEENSFIMNHFMNELSPQLQRDVIVKLFEFCRKQLDKQRQSRGKETVPWRCSVIAFGSSARFEATPNSDFEWGILVDDNGSLDSDCRNYFRELTTLFHFLVISLGETILPAMAIEELEAEYFFDETTVRGFAFDGLMPNACKWPLGNLHHHNWDPTATGAFELIGRPVDLAEFQSAENYKKHPEFSFSLLNARLICGEQHLFDMYCQECTRVIRSSQESIERIRSSVLNLLREDCKQYRIKSYHMNSSGTFLNPKDMYRLFDRSILALWFYERLSDPQYQQEPLVVAVPTVELLNRVSYLGNHEKANIRDAIQLSLWLRLNTHQAQSGRDMLPATNAHIELIRQYYRIAIPFGDKLFEILESSSPSLDSLRSEEFVFRNTEMLNAIVMFRLGRLEQCNAILEEAAKSFQDDDETERLRKWYLAHAEMYLGNRSKAAELFDELLQNETDRNEAVRLKVLKFHALSYLPVSEHLIDLELELQENIFDDSTSVSSATHAALELLRYYQLFNMVREERVLLERLYDEKREVINHTHQLITWIKLIWTNKNDVINHYREKQRRLLWLYAGTATYRFTSVTKFLRFCIRYDCIDEVEDQIKSLKPHCQKPFEKLVIVNFEFFHALQHQQWSVARDRLGEWEQLLKGGEVWMRMNHFQALFLASKLNFHLKNESVVSRECEQHLQRSIALWENTPEIEKRGSDWGDLVLFIGEIQRERGRLDEAYQYLALAHNYFCLCKDHLKVATSLCAYLKTYVRDRHVPGNIDEQLNYIIRVFKKHRLYLRLVEAYFAVARLFWFEHRIALVLRWLVLAEEMYCKWRRLGGSVDPTLEGNIATYFEVARIRLRSEFIEGI